jgi:hypothetical protein
MEIHSKINKITILITYIKNMNKTGVKKANLIKASADAMKIAKLLSNQVIEAEID